MTKIVSVGGSSGENLVVADAPIVVASADVPGVIPFAPAGSGSTGEANLGRNLTPAARVSAMRRAVPLESPFPELPTVGSGSAAERKQLIRDYFYQRREAFTQGLLLQRPELRDQPQTVIDLADQWVARNIVRGMSGNRAGIAAVNARGMLIAIDARIRELEASGQAIPADLLAARQAAASTVNEVRGQLRAKGFSDDEINRYLGFVGPRINSSTQGWEQQVTELRRDPNYTPVKIPQAAQEPQQRQGAIVPPAERHDNATVRIAFQPGLEDHGARVRAEREAVNESAVAHANERIALARVVMAARLRQDLHIGGPLSSLV